MRGFWAALAILACSLATPAPVLAHAELVTSSPLPNASLVEAPDRLRVTFSEPIDSATSSVELLDPQLRQIDGIGPPAIEDEGTTITVALPPLDAGIYTVSYQVVSTVDGHATRGLFAFVVDPTGAEAPPTTPPVSSSPSVDGWAIAARWLALVAALVGLGSLTTWWQAGRPALEFAAPRADRRPPWRMVTLSGAGVVSGVILYLALAARPLAPLDGSTTGVPFDPSVLLGSTPFAVAMRVAIIAALVAAALAFVGIGRSEHHHHRPLAAVVGVGFAISLAGMSAAGHASSLGGPLNAAIDWLHLVAAAAWLGGLPAMYGLAGRAGPAGSRRGIATEILRRHGRMALVAGPLVVLTGLANSSLVLGTSRELVASGYGNLLLVKGVLVSVALGIGAANHLLVRGRARGRGATTVLMASELLVGAVAVMAAAALVTIQPSAARQPVVVGPSVQPAHFFGEAGPSRIHASVSVPAPGTQSYQVTVRDAQDGRPRPDIQRVFLTLTPPAETDLTAQRIELDPAELDGLYTTSGAYTPIVGDWSLDVIVRRTGARDETASFSMLVNEPSEPIVVPPPDTGVGVPVPLAMLWGVLPGGAAGWIPGAVAIAAVVAIGLGRWRLAPLRVMLLATATVLILAVGSRSLVEAANRPSASDLAAYEGAPVGSVEAGQRIYLANCAGCHGTDGEGDGPVRSVPDPAPLAKSLPGMSDAEVSYRIANGLAGTSMPPFAASLSEQERRDLVSYLRQRWRTP
ncbi:MAG: copper resistance protein CopC [Chloroflexota bacterium]